MASRRIDAAEITEVLAAPDTTHPARDNPDEAIVVFGRTSSGRRLKVIVRADDNEYVITVADRDSEA
jgi:hypothetical protein